jgi:hypothetical protein
MTRTRPGETAPALRIFIGSGSVVFSLAQGRKIFHPYIQPSCPLWCNSYLILCSWLADLTIGEIAALCVIEQIILFKLCEAVVVER